MKPSDQIADLLRDLRDRINSSWPETVLGMYADGDLLARIDAVLATPPQAPSITQPARVDGVRFMPGVQVSTVLEAAYRFAQYQPSEEEAATAATRFDVLMAAVHGRLPAGWRLVPESWLPDGDGQIPSCMSAAGARRLKVLADLDLTYYELDEVFRAMLAAAPLQPGEEATPSSSGNEVHLFQARSGQWGALLLKDGEECARIGGCASEDEAIEAVTENGWSYDRIVYPADMGAGA